MLPAPKALSATQALSLPAAETLPAAQALSLPAAETLPAAQTLSLPAALSQTTQKGQSRRRAAAKTYHLCAWQ